MGAIADLFASLLSPAPVTPVRRAQKAYRVAYEAAQSDNDWSAGRLIAAMKELTVPGAFSEHDDSWFERTLTLWSKRVPPRKFNAESRHWPFDGGRPVT